MKIKRFTLAFKTILRLCAFVFCCVPLVAGGQGAQAREYYVSVADGDDANPGTQEAPFKTIQKAADMARGGDVVKILPGIYVEQVLITRGGSKEAPIVFESTQWHGAVMTDRACCFKHVGEAEYITLRGIWFRDCPLADGGLFQTQVIVPSRGWRIEDCRFTRCGVGLGYDRRATDTSETAVVRTVFEDMDATASWAWAAKGQRMRDHQLIDTVFRRCNGINNDPAWQGQGAKYGYTENLLVEGLICYDNNGPGLWLDWNNDAFTVRNCTFFGNHAGWAYANFTDQHLSNTWWIGDGMVSECNGSGRIIDNVAYGNLGAGIAVWESGHLGGIEVSGNTLVENGINLELRGMVRNDFGDPAWIDRVTVTNNRFMGWKYACWMTASLDDTLRGKALPADANCVFEGNAYAKTASSLNGLYGKWRSEWALGLSEMQEKFNVEAQGTEIPFTFDTAIPAVHDTQLTDVGTDAMWQIDSRAQEENDFTKAIGDKGPGDEVLLPVTAHKGLVAENGDWYTVIYDLQMRQIWLYVTSAQKAWVEENIRPYASIEQTQIRVKLTVVEPYRIEAVLLEN